MQLAEFWEIIEFFSGCKCVCLLLVCLQLILELLGMGNWCTLVEQADAPVSPTYSTLWILHHQLCSALLCRKEVCMTVNAFIIVAKVAHR